MRRRALFVVILTLASCPRAIDAQAASGHDRIIAGAREACTLPITVHVAVAATRSDERFVAVLRDEVERIWSRHDIAFDWTIPLPPISPLDRPRLWVVMADGPLAWRVHPQALAALYFAGEAPTNQIRLASPSAIMHALRRSDHRLAGVPHGSQAQLHLVGRIQGRALAHELGHYLLASKRHASSGLMRAEAPLFEMAESSDHGGFALDASSLAALRARRTATCASLASRR